MPGYALSKYMRPRDEKRERTLAKAFKRMRNRKALKEALDNNR